MQNMKQHALGTKILAGIHIYIYIYEYRYIRQAFAGQQAAVYATPVGVERVMLPNIHSSWFPKLVNQDTLQDTLSRNS